MMRSRQPGWAMDRSTRVPRGRDAHRAAADREPQPAAEAMVDLSPRGQTLQALSRLAHGGPAAIAQRMLTPLASGGGPIQRAIKLDVGAIIGDWGSDPVKEKIATDLADPPKKGKPKYEASVAVLGPSEEEDADSDPSLEVKAERPGRGSTSEKEEGPTEGEADPTLESKGEKDAPSDDDDEPVFDRPKIVAEILQKAKALGYSPDAANRLVARNPYKKSEIKGETKADASDGTVTSFGRFETGFSMPQHHKLFFYNQYKNGVWTMHDNFRNPYMADFFANDVITIQVAELKETKGGKDESHPGAIIRANVVSGTGKKWRADNKVPPGALSAEHLASFMATENGKHTARIAGDRGLKVVAGALEAGGLDSFNVILTLGPKTASA